MRRARLPLDCARRATSQGSLRSAPNDGYRAPAEAAVSDPNVRGERRSSHCPAAAVPRLGTLLHEPEVGSQGLSDLGEGCAGGADNSALNPADLSLGQANPLGQLDLGEGVLLP